MTNFTSIQEVLKNAGIDTSNIQFRTKNDDDDEYMVENKLKMLDDHNAICSKCKKVISLNSLNIEQRDRVESTGLCLNCLPQKVIPTIKPVATKSTRGNTISAGELARSLIFTAIPNITPEHMDLLTDQEYSYINFGVLYSLFLDVTGYTDREIIVMKCHKGHSRYTRTKYNILNREYLITNDIYARNVPRIKDKFIELGLITEEQALALGFTDSPVTKTMPIITTSKSIVNFDNDEIIEDWSDHKEESVAKRIRREQREARAALLTNQEKPVKTVDVLNFSNSPLVKTKVAKQVKQVGTIDIEAIRKQAKVEAEQKAAERKNNKQHGNFKFANKLHKKQIQELNADEKYAHVNL